MPPDWETGVVRQPARRSAKKVIPQRRREAEILRIMESMMMGMFGEKIGNVKQL
jgi:hypothetical protein